MIDSTDEMLKFKSMLHCAAARWVIVQVLFSL